jgi:hypothetical protein
VEKSSIGGADIEARLRRRASGWMTGQARAWPKVTSEASAVFEPRTSSWTRQPRVVTSRLSVSRYSQLAFGITSVVFPLSSPVSQRSRS